MKTVAIILAAGRENKMQSQQAKELHMLMGCSVLETVVDAVKPVVERSIAVLGHHAEELLPALPKGCESCVQDFSLGQGTAKAAATALPFLIDDDRVLITAGDMPCVSTASYAALAQTVDGTTCQAAVLYADVRHPEGSNRIVFDGDGDVRCIAKSDLLMPHEEDIHSINLNVYCMTAAVLKKHMASLQPDLRGVYHMTDLVGEMAETGVCVRAVQAEDPREGKRIVDRADLAQAFAYVREQHCRRHMLGGVTIIDPAVTYIESDVEIGMDTVIYPGCLLQKGTRVGKNCVLMPNCRIAETVLHDGAVVENSILIGCEVDGGALVGPFAALHGAHVRKEATKD